MQGYPGEKTMLRVMLVAILLCTAGVGLYVYWPQSSGPIKAPVAPKAVTKLAKPDSPAFRRHQSVLALLEQEDYPALERQLLLIRNSADSAPGDELLLVELFDSIAATDEHSQARLRAWLEARPETPDALAALAIQSIERAWQKRGHGYSADVPESDMEEFKHLMAIAAEQASQALVEDAQHPIAHLAQLRSARGLGAAKGCADVAGRFQKDAPNNYLIWKSFITCLVPRWGGSHQAVAQAAEAAQIHVSRNPRLKTLLGFPFWSVARDLRSAGKYAEALEWLNKAFAWGDDVDFLQQRIGINLRLKNFEQACRDSIRYREWNPFDEKDYLEISLKRFREHAMELHRQGDRADAIEAYSAYLSFNPKDSAIFFWRGNAHSSEAQFEQALVDFRQAYSLDPDSIGAVKKIDWVLAKDARWDEIILTWSSYISTHPNDADAYMERGGAHFQKRDMQSAHADAVQSCSLGRKDACVWAQRTKSAL